MKVINKTTKIIGIGGVPLLPGEEIAVSEDVAASPMVQHFSTIGKIALEPESAPSKGKGKGKGKGKDKDESDNDSDSTGSTGGEDESKNVSKKRFGKLYDQALALLTAHRMKLSGAFDAASEEGGSSIGSLADTLRVASYTEGSTSISFNNGVSLAANDAELTLTGYGTQYLSLRRMVIMPITSAGEAR